MKTKPSIIRMISGPVTCGAFACITSLAVHYADWRIGAGAAACAIGGFLIGIE